MRKSHRFLKGIVWLGALVAVAAAVLWFVPSNSIMLAPGITGDLSKMVKVEGGHTPGPGKLFMVAVTVDRVNELVYLAAHLDPNVELLPAKQAMGGLSMKQYVQYNMALMQQSQWAAEVAGEKLAGLPARLTTVPGALVSGVMKSGAAYGKLKPGDLIVKVGPYPVTNASKVRQILLQHYKVGEIVNFTIVYHHQQRLVPIRTMHIQNDSAPAIGVLISSIQKPVIPRPVHILAQNIGGPSAGMMFALEIYDQVTGNNLARGRLVAGTGEVYPNGMVGPIGGVAQKVITVHRAGVRVFLCPVANYQKAVHMAKLKGYHMKIYPVANLSQALHDLQKKPS